MMTSSAGSSLIVDADAHITEPPDVWTARVPKKYAEVLPHVAVHPKTGHHHWRVGDSWYWPVAGGMLSQAGWPEPMPSSPWEYEEADPAVYKAEKRLERMDEYGIDVQIVYPNIIGFISAALIPLGIEVSAMAVRAWNDFILEWCSADSRRLVPMAMLPFWDMDAALAEMERCVNRGFKGVLFANKFERIGLPSFVSPHWDPIYAAAQDFDIPINYHVGFGAHEDVLSEDSEVMGAHLRNSSPEEMKEWVRWASTGLVNQDDLLGQILLSGLCERFPRLRLVSVETGFGHIPFYLETLDWHCRTYGFANPMPLLPSEYFKRQCYGTYWYERSTLRDLENFPDNFMFSTDFPHGTSLAPGACAGTTLMPSAYVSESHANLDPAVRDKALSGNAAAVYKVLFGSGCDRAAVTERL